MDQEHENNLSPEENAWLDEILPPEDLGEELGPHADPDCNQLLRPTLHFDLSWQGRLLEITVTQT